jgi:hypothetical protein
MSEPLWCEVRQHYCRCHDFGKRCDDFDERAAPQENKVDAAPSGSVFFTAGTCTGRGLPNEPAVAAPSGSGGDVER